MSRRVVEKIISEESVEMKIEHYDKKGKVQMVVKCTSNFLSGDAAKEFSVIFNRQILEE